MERWGTGASLELFNVLYVLYLFIKAYIEIKVGCGCRL